MMMTTRNGVNRNNEDTSTETCEPFYRVGVPDFGHSVLPPTLLFIYIEEKAATECAINYWNVRFILLNFVNTDEE